MFGLFNKTANAENAEALKRALGPQAITVISASCCMQGTAELDDRTREAAQAALASAGLDWPLQTITLTQAQGVLPKIAGELDKAQGALAAQVTELFTSYGLSAFPVLMVDQRVVSYGGAPDAALILDALDARKAHENAA